MMHREVQEKVAAALVGQPGWQRPPRQDHHFEHPATDVHVLIYNTQIIVTFGRVGHRHSEVKSVVASTRYYPSLAIASSLEVARALVAVREAAAEERAAGGSAGG